MSTSNESEVMLPAALKKVLPPIDLKVIQSDHAKAYVAPIAGQLCMLHPLNSRMPAEAWVQVSIYMIDSKLIRQATFMVHIEIDNPATLASI